MDFITRDLNNKGELCSGPEDGSCRGDAALPEGLNQVEVCELMKLHKGMKDLDIEVISA